MGLKKLTPLKQAPPRAKFRIFFLHHSQPSTFLSITVCSGAGLSESTAGRKQVRTPPLWSETFKKANALQGRKEATMEALG